MEDQQPSQPTPPPEPVTPTDKELAEEYLAGWKRATADYANLKREVERDRTEMAKFAGANVISNLLPIFDNFTKALQHRPPSDADSSQFVKWADGIMFIKTQFEGALKYAGLTLIDDASGAFDPNRHEAVMSEEKEGVASGDVVRLLEPGYQLHGKVLRPAKVVVAR